MNASLHEVSLCICALTEHSLFIRKAGQHDMGKVHIDLVELQV